MCLLQDISVSSMPAAFAILGALHPQLGGSSFATAAGNALLAPTAALRARSGHCRRQRSARTLVIRSQWDLSNFNFNPLGEQDAGNTSGRPISL